MLLSGQKLAAIAIIVLVRGIAGMPTIDSINRIDPPGFYQKADTNLHCFSKDGQHVALAIDETLELERSIARWCNSTASHAPIAKGEIISSSVLEPTLESHGHVVHYQIANDICDEPLKVTYNTCSIPLLAAMNQCYDSPGKEGGTTAGGLYWHGCGFSSLRLVAGNDSLRKQMSTTHAISHEVVKRNATTTGMCQGCASCVAVGSSCTPPGWGSCSDVERGCILANACEFASCLKAGYCLACS